MSTQIPWILPLGLKPAEVEHWKLELKPGESLIFRAIEKGRIDWSKYQEWAINFYQLSAVNEDYFLQPPPMEFWKLIQSVANWSPALLPLEEWDGTIFIGCVEPPPADIIWSFPVQFVLASPTSLKNRWQKYHQEPPVIVAVPPTPSESFELTPIPADGAAPEAPAAPEGLSFALGEVKKVELAFDLEVGTGPSTPEEFLNQFKTPDAPTTVPREAPAETLPEDSLIGIKLDMPPEISIIGPAPAELPPPAPEPASSLSTEIPVMPESLPEISIVKPKPIDMPAPVMKATPSVPEISLVIAPIESAPPTIPVVTLNEVEDEESAMVAAFTEMKMFFDQSMYLKWDGQSFLPCKWNEGWKPVPGAEQIPIQTNVPSLFRIVVRTQHSYHGKIMPTPVHESFFKSWGLVGLPDMATVIPIKVQGALHGILLSVGPESSVEARVLQHAEKVAGRLQFKLDQLSGPKVA